MSVPSSVRLLVGREQQLAIVEEHLDGLTKSRGSLLVLAGESGIGKTRLLEEIVELADAREISSSWATCWRGEGSPPLWPWVQILRQVVGSAGTLEQFLPDSPAQSPAARFAQFEAVADLLRVEVARGPLLVVIDDLQWADGASIELLSFIASSLRDVSCLFVASYRPDEFARDHKAELARVGTTVAVPPLSTNDVSVLLRASVGADVSGAWPRRSTLAAVAIPCSCGSSAS